MTLAVRRKDNIFFCLIQYRVRLSSERIKPLAARLRVQVMLMFCAYMKVFNFSQEYYVRKHCVMLSKCHCSELKLQISPNTLSSEPFFRRKKP